jgi:ribonuclease J
MAKQSVTPQEEPEMAARLKITPLGGLGEVGKNMMAIEYGRNILVIDAGLMFPETRMLGVDYIIPDWSYLREKKERVRALVITHGHMDHIGALHHFLGEFDVPVYATRLTRGLIEVKLKREHMLGQVELHTFSAGDIMNVGPFTIEPFHVCHSIPDTVGLGITTPAGLVVHSGDFKLDPTPVDGLPTDIPKLAEFSQRGVMALLSDSTNADQPGITPSEAVLDDVLEAIMREAPGRVIIATFASLIARIQQVVNVAARGGRKIAVAGRAMLENTRMARELGYLDIPEDMLLTLGEIGKVPPGQLVIMATGSQGEPMGILSRLATGRHSSLRVHEGDTVVFSSHTIPGNEEVIHDVINRLFQRGADVYYDPVAPVHVSGHASQEEQKLMLNIVRPSCFVPIHGELRHLAQHGKLAREVGIPPENVAVVENGYELVFDDGHMDVGRRAPGGYVFVEGSLVGETTRAVLDERDALGQNGLVHAVLQYRRRTGQPLGRPHLITHGFVEGVPELLSRAEDVVREAAFMAAGTPPDAVERAIEQALSDFVYDETRTTPVIIATVVD